jgi:CRP-like cAMP-binding protein
MTKEIELLKKTITAIYPMQEDEMNLFLEPWKLDTISRKQTITVAGQKENYLYFTTEGVQRIFYVDEQGWEATILFTYSPSFGGVVDAFLLQQPSRYYYESLTASTYLQISYSQLNNLMLKSKAVEAFVRKALSHSLSGLLERIVDLQCYSSEEKFRKLLQRSPHILQLVPQKYIASYLGIDATNFSKLMNSVRI